MATMPAPGVVTPPAPNAPSEYERGLKLRDRQTIVAVFTRLPVHPLNAARQIQLDALLERCGKDMVPLPEGQYTASRVRRAISSFGEQPAASPGSIGQQHFVTAGGRIELLDDRGVFRPADESEPVRVAMPTDDDAAAVPKKPPVYIGTYVYSSTTLPTAPGAAPKPASSFPKINPTATLLVGIETAISFGLAAFLLVCGIQAVRSSLSAGRMHMIYALIKIPTVVFGMIAAWWMANSFMSGLPGTPTGAGSPAATCGMSSAVWMALGLIYPIALLITLRTRSMREYFNKPR
jgi:hypothetical protein